MADEVGATSVAFPVISTGVYGYPMQEAAAVALDAIRSAATNVEHVKVVVFNEAALTAYRAVS